MSTRLSANVSFGVEIAKGVDLLDNPDETDWSSLPGAQAISWAVADIDSRDLDGYGRARWRDAARALDPEHTSGLEPWTHIRFRLTHGGSTETVFRGYTPAWDVADGRWVNEVPGEFVPLTAAFQRPVPNPFAYLADLTGADAVWLLDRGGDSFTTPDGDAAGQWSTPPTVASGALLQVEAGYTTFDGGLTGRVGLSEFTPPTALPHVHEAVVSFDGGDTSGTFEVFASFDGSNSVVVALTYDADAGTVTLTAWSSLASASNGIVTAAMPAADWETGRAVAYRVTSTREELWIDGAKASTSSTAAPTAPTSTGTHLGGGSGGGRRNLVGAMADVAVHTVDVADAFLADRYDGLTGWANDRVGERVGRLLDVFGWDPGLRDLPAGIVSCGPWDHTGRDLLDELRVLRATEGGRLFVAGDGAVTLRDRHYYATATEGSTSQATFSDDPTETAAGAVPYRGLQRSHGRWDDLVNDVTAQSRPTGAARRRRDASSVKRRGEQPPNGYDLPTVAAPEELLSLAAAVVDEKKDPRLRIPSIEFYPLRDDNGSDYIDEALDREIGHRITLHRTPQATGAEIDAELEVDGIAQSLTVDEWLATIYVVAARTASGWWSPGTSKVGVDSVWAP